MLILKEKRTKKSEYILMNWKERQHVMDCGKWINAIYLLVIDLLKASVGDSLVPINEMSHAAIHNGKE